MKPAEHTNRDGEVLILRRSNKDGMSYGGFQWPLEVGATVKADDARRDNKCGGGLHGWAWGYGIGDGHGFDVVDDTWIVFSSKPEDVIGELDGGMKVKAVGECRIVAVGTFKECWELIRRGAAALRAETRHEERKCVYGRRTSVASDASVAIADGHCAKSSASGYESRAIAIGEHIRASSSGDASTASAVGTHPRAVSAGEDTTAAASGHSSMASSAGERSKARADGNAASAAANGYLSWAIATGVNSRAVSLGGRASADSVAVSINGPCKVGKGGTIVIIRQEYSGSIEVFVGKEGVDIEADQWYAVIHGKLEKTFYA